MVPKELRRQFELEAGTVLDWRVEGDSLRVVKLARSEKRRFFTGTTASGAGACRSARQPAGGGRLRFLLGTNIITEVAKPKPNAPL